MLTKASGSQLNGKKSTQMLSGSNCGQGVGHDRERDHRRL